MFSHKRRREDSWEAWSLRSRTVFFEVTWTEPPERAVT